MAEKLPYKGYMIQPVFRELMSIEPVFVYLMQQFVLVWDTKGEYVNTAGVSINSSRDLLLIINPEYFKNLPFNERVGLIYHECCHIVFDHISQFKLLDQEIANIVMDVEIDQKIPLNYRFARPLLPLTVKPLNNSLDNQDFIYYYEEFIKNKGNKSLYQNPNAKGKKGSVDNQGEAHSNDEHIWSDIEMSSESIKQTLKIAVNLAYQQNKAGNGKISGFVETGIKNLLKPSKIKWEKYLENLIGSVISISPQSTRSRPNKKLGYLSAGVKDGTNPSLLIFVDISGSHLNNEDLIKSFNQVKKIVEDYQEDTRVFFFADGVFNESILVNADIKTIPKIPGTGGTSFDEIFIKANQFDDVEAVIILTDGDAKAPTIKPTKYRVIWGLTHGDRSYLKFGDKVLIGD